MAAEILPCLFAFGVGFLGGLQMGAASQGCFRETKLAWRSIELLPVQLWARAVSLPSAVIHLKNLFCVAVAAG